MFFKVIYYLIGLAIVVYQLYFLNKDFIKDMYEIWRESDELKKEGKKFDTDLLDEDFKKKILGFALMMLIQLAWFFIGIFTFNWVLFVAYFIYGFIVGKVGNWKKSQTTFLTMAGISKAIVVSIILFSIINSFHLHINLFEQLKVLFGG